MADITPMRTIRISDELWKAAQAKAGTENTTVSDAIRRFLEDWTGKRSETYEDRLAILERIEDEEKQRRHIIKNE